MNSAKLETKTLHHLLKDVDGVRLPAQNPTVTGIVLDSREITPGAVFIAVKGHSSDGRDFIGNAIDNGAIAIIAEADNEFDGASFSVPVVLVNGLNRFVSQIAGNFYDHPSKKMRVIGITGTNGKTTCAQLLMQMYNLLGEKAASVGTMGYGFSQSNLTDFGLTTPDAVVSQRVLSELYAQGARVIAMEVSSHGLDQFRVAAIKFEGAVFTNISRDHLDFHGTLENYIAAKSRLFNQAGLAYAVINGDDAAGVQYLQTTAAAQVYAYGLAENNAVKARDCQYSTGGTQAFLQSPWGQGELHSGLVGEFNVYNLLATLAAVCASGVSFDQALNVLTKVNAAKGRLEQVVQTDSDIFVCVDYAHTPDALEKALKTLRQNSREKLWVVFGCGGDRDKGKRPQMAAVASQWADVVVVTSDNPRTEDPQSIIDDALAGIDYSASQVMPMVDRELAIEYAIIQASPHDTVLVAGKGHENYQIIGQQKLPFDDVCVCQKALAKRRDFLETDQ